MSQDGIKERVQVDTLLPGQIMRIFRRIIYWCTLMQTVHSVTVKKERKAGITSGVTAGTLSSVDNTQNGITYIKDGVQYYCASAKGSPVKMCEQTEQTDTAYTLLYKNRLYFYDAQRQLIPVQKKGMGLRRLAMSAVSGLEQNISKTVKYLMQQYRAERR